MDLSNTDDKFEESWKNAFENASIKPSRNVWKRINQRLTEIELASYKEQLAIYKTAAVIALLFTITAVIGSFVSPESDSQQLVSSNVTGLVSKEAVSLRTSKSEDKTVIHEFELAGHEVKDTKPNPYAVGGLSDESYSEFNALAFLAPKESENWLLEVKSVRIPSRRKSQSLYRDDYFFSDYAELNNEKEDKRGFYTSLAVGSSSFDPNYQSNLVSPTQSSIIPTETGFLNTVTTGSSTIESVTETMNTGVDYRVGMNVGMKISKKFSVESGLQFGQTQFNSSTSLLVQNRIFTKTLRVNSEGVFSERGQENIDNDTRVEYSREEINVMNALNYATIPVKAGYQLLERKVSVSVEAGLLTSMLLGHSMTNLAQNETVQFSRNEESTYRNLVFSGMAGVSFGYNLMKRFDLMVQPNVSRSLQPLTRAGEGFDTTPNRFGLNAGVRYNFR